MRIKIRHGNKKKNIYKDQYTAKTISPRDTLFLDNRIPQKYFPNTIPAGGNVPRINPFYAGTIIIPIKREIESRQRESRPIHPGKSAHHESGEFSIGS